jgi:hypothetical protein
MDDCLRAALDYAEKGLSVIPVRPDKTPYIKWTEYQKCCATAEEIRAWFKKWPNALIGIITGKISGLFVIDCDNEEAYQRIQELMPDSFITCVAKTPKGYHLYFVYSDDRTISSVTGVMPKVDIRGEGGYIIAPPSVNSEGNPYSWQLSLEYMSPPPDTVLNIFNKHIYRESSPDVTERYKTLPSVTISLTEGSRDDSLFHIANSLIKGGMTEQNATYILDILGRHCIPPFPEKEISTKIESAIKRARAREREYQKEVEKWVSVTDGYWFVTECNQALQCVTKEQKAAVRTAIHRLCKAGLIEKNGTKDGCYRRVETEVEPVNFLTAPTDEFNIIFPKIYPGNIIIIAGSKSAGKTVWLLNTVRLNMDRHDIVYLNSEMGDTEFRMRLEGFSDVRLEDWRFKPYHRSSNFADLITSERKIFIVDFLEVTKDFWLVAEYIQEIHRKLKDGICIIALQKSDEKEMGRGGDFSKEKTRLYLSLDYLKDQKINLISLVDAKAWRGTENPRGKKRSFKVAGGAKIIPCSDWKE